VSCYVTRITSGHLKVELAGLLAISATRANLVPDAHLAALALEHGLTLCSSDGDFARFKGLRWENPLSK
jgi:predicted nucleic acid-binding protein